MKLRNLTVVRKTGLKLLAGLLAIGLTIGTPISVLATDIQTEVGSGIDGNIERLQAKKVDGTDELVDISDKVLEMIQKEEVKLMSKRIKK